MHELLKRIPHFQRKTIEFPQGSKEQKYAEMIFSFMAERIRAIMKKENSLPTYPALKRGRYNWQDVKVAKTEIKIPKATELFISLIP